MGFQFNRDGAMKAGASEFITESGVYVGKITKAVETKYDSGAASIDFEFTSNSGLTSPYLKVFITKKDGSESYGMNHIYALMGLLRFANVDPVLIDAEHKGYPIFCNKPIGIILQRENKEDGKFNMSILHFVDAVTLKTFTEQAKNEEAKESKKEIKDKNSKPANVDTSFNFGANVKNNHDTSNDQIDAMFGPSKEDQSLPW